MANGQRTSVVYFAYGSNMALRRLRARVPSAEVLGIGLLAGHSLRFHKVGRDGSGKCDVFRTDSRGEQVEGRLFTMDPGGVPVLDQVEGEGRGYQRREVRIALPGGGSLDAFAYFATHIDARLRPFNWYKRHVLTGAGEAGLSRGYRAAIEVVASVSDPDPARAQAELAIYR